MLHMNDYKPPDKTTNCGCQGCITVIHKAANTFNVDSQNYNFSVCNNNLGTLNACVVLSLEVLCI